MGRATCAPPTGDVAQGLHSGPAALPTTRVVAAPQTKEYGFLLPGSETSLLKHHGRDVKTTSRWKSRRAGVRALRYVFSPCLTFQWASV